MRRNVVFVVIAICFSFHYIMYRRRNCSQPSYGLLFQASVNFDNFDNVSGTESGKFIIPNIVHFIRFGNESLTFKEAVCMLSSLKNQKPERLVIHTDNYDTINHGYDKYLEIVGRHPLSQGKLEVRFLRQPETIFGQELSGKWRNYHAADVARLEVLMAEGGIFLDRDSYVARNLNEFRAYEMALGWREGESISKHAIIAHKDARFLSEWYNSYKDYRKNELHYNAVNKPTQILKRKPHLIHRVPFLFAEFHNIMRLVYVEKSTDWTMHYVINLLIIKQKHDIRRCLSGNATYDFDERNILKCDSNIKDMVKDVYSLPPQ